MTDLKPMTPLWESFADICMQGAPPKALEGGKAIFYSGAYALFIWMMRDLDNSSDEVTPADAREIEAMHAELRSFLTSVPTMRETLQ